MKYVIERPPITYSFELPSREELLKVKIGDYVKLIFRVEEEVPERMWVRVTQQQDVTEWTGEVANDATQEQTAHVLPEGAIVKFYPGDIIQITEDKK